MSEFVDRFFYSVAVTNSIFLDWENSRKLAYCLDFNATMPDGTVLGLKVANYIGCGFIFNEKNGAEFAAATEMIDLRKAYKLVAVDRLEQCNKENKLHVYDSLKTSHLAHNSLPLLKSIEDFEDRYGIEG